MPKSIQSNFLKGQESEFLKRQEAADFLNLKKCTLEAWAVKGGGPVMSKFGRSVRYRISDLENFVNGAKRASTSTSEA